MRQAPKQVKNTKGALGRSDLSKPDAEYLGPVSDSTAISDVL